MIKGYSIAIPLVHINRSLLTFQNIIHMIAEKFFSISRVPTNALHSGHNIHSASYPSSNPTAKTIADANNSSDSYVAMAK